MLESSFELPWITSDQVALSPVSVTRPLFSLRTSATHFLEISSYLSTISNPTPARSASDDATRVLPVPRKGSTTSCPFFVKKRMNSRTRDSGKDAGCRIFWSPRGMGRWTNQDFVNFIHSVPDNSFSLFSRTPGFSDSSREACDSTMKTAPGLCPNSPYPSRPTLRRTRRGTEKAFELFYLPLFSCWIR